MRNLRPNRFWYALFFLGGFVVFLLGAAVWQILLQGNPTDCSYKGVICLFLPDSSDWYIHLISYLLMGPLLAAMILFFNTWRKQRLLVNRLTHNMTALAISSDKLDTAAQKCDLDGKVYVVDFDEHVCLCAGFFSPNVYVSRSVVESLTGEELEALLLHERYHLKNRDPLNMLVGQAIVSGLVLFPVLKDMFKRCLVRKEIAADQHAIQCQGGRRGIASTLQKLLGQDTIAQTAGFAIGGTDELKARVDYMLGRKNHEAIPLFHIAVSASIFLLVIGIIIFIRQPALHYPIH